MINCIQKKLSKNQLLSKQGRQPEQWWDYKNTKQQ